MFGPAFSETGFNAVRAISDSMNGNGIKKVFVEDETPR